MKTPTESTVVAYLRATLFAVGAFVTMLFFTITGLITAPLPFRFRYRYLSGWGKFATWWLRVTCRLDYRIQGLENLPRGPAIVLCKHQSSWETLVLQEIFPPHTWVLKRELMWIPPFGWALALLRPIAINRKSGHRAVEQIITQGSARLDEGIWITIFPEGTRVAPRRTKRWGMGGALLAEHSGAPIVPVAHNAGSYWARRTYIKCPGTITLVIGPAITTTGLSATEINTRAQSWMTQTMHQLEGETAST